ncbi:PREDICTED: putative FBD-associated F-box protein At5g53635 [Camelina sativa]|uniref:FBD-associated F-box protein At5g53635 n=1 Tax=Camelina sativa TaxID=90675 RepID=A0ABM0Y494_CAMSA|nr:PREDICTED: putative FBD-associated F-box protein At5g53635 [Camelina sativa]
MVEREKEKQACSKGKEDRISQLPDPLICHILSHLPLKEAVKTSVISTRWRSLWLWLPRLELTCWKFPNSNAFMSFGDTFLDSNRVSYIDNLKVTIDKDASHLTSWIDAAVKRKVKHIDLSCHRLNSCPELPTSTYTCETLVSLKLDRADLANAKIVFLPCLKTLHLESISYPNEAIFERLVSSCPVLEELVMDVKSVFDDNAIHFRVFSRSLKKLKINIRKCRYSSISSCSGVVIDAPLLRFLSINDDLSESLVVINKMHPDAKLDISSSFDFGLNFFGPFAKLDISTFFDISKRNSIRGFLSQISKVKDMKICRDTVKLIYHYSKLESLPQFGYLSCLNATILYSELKELLTFLNSCPNLKSLILVCYGSCDAMPFEEINQISLSYKPECLLSSLEFIDFEFRCGGYVPLMKIVRYFLENTAILKKLTLRLANCPIRVKSTVKEELHRMSRCSSECEIVVTDWYLIRSFNDFL